MKSRHYVSWASLWCLLFYENIFKFLKFSHIDIYINYFCVTCFYKYLMQNCLPLLFILLGQFSCYLFAFIETHYICLFLVFLFTCIAIAFVNFAAWLLTFPKIIFWLSALRSQQQPKPGMKFFIQVAQCRDTEKDRE